MTRKQEIYQQILELSLPYMRTTLAPLQGHSVVAAVRRMGSATAVDYVCEIGLFVQHVTPTLFVEEFVEHDIHMLNTHARSFHKREEVKNCPLYLPLVQLIEELFTLVPEAMRSRLSWPGPQNVKEMIEQRYQETVSKFTT
jgi:hypothetical protein